MEPGHERGANAARRYIIVSIATVPSGPEERFDLRLPPPWLALPRVPLALPVLSARTLAEPVAHEAVQGWIKVFWSREDCSWRACTGCDTLRGLTTNSRRLEAAATHFPLSPASYCHGRI